MGFDYETQYRNGSENLADDALSRVQGSYLLNMAISVVISDLETKIQASYQLHPNMLCKISKLRQGEKLAPYTIPRGLLRRHNKIVVGPDSQLRNSIISCHHGSLETGHVGRDATTMRVKRLFYWRNMIKHIRQLVRECATCQAAKYDPLAYLGLLQPLPMPDEVWRDISMDFISGLPLSGKKDTIFVVVDRFSKSAHFMALAHPYTAIQVAHAYLDHVFKLHG